MSNESSRVGQFSVIKGNYFAVVDENTKTNWCQVPGVTPDYLAMQWMFPSVWYTDIGHSKLEHEGTVTMHWSNSDLHNLKILPLNCTVVDTTLYPAQVLCFTVCFCIPYCLHRNPNTFLSISQNWVSLTMWNTISIVSLAIHEAYVLGRFQVRLITNWNTSLYSDHFGLVPMVVWFQWWSE